MSQIVIKITPAFTRGAKRLLDKASLQELYEYLALHPTAGDIIKGTGGVRKLRWKTNRSNKGKSGGLRVLYHYSNDILVILITLYVKSEKETITKEEGNELRYLVPKLIIKYMEGL